MPFRRILLVYGTSYGQTARISERIRQVLARQGHQVTVFHGDHVPRGLSLAAYDGVIVGSSVIMTGHQRAVRNFVRTYRDALNLMPSAFFSVSGSAGSARPEGRADARRILDRFLEKMAWTPELAETIAGAVLYTRYNPLLRWYMKRASAINGGSTDTSRDHEYTDWYQVERFAEDFAALLAARAGAPELVIDRPAPQLAHATTG